MWKWNDSKKNIVGEGEVNKNREKLKGNEKNV
jgi:hypothetical protein